MGYWCKCSTGPGPPCFLVSGDLLPPPCVSHSVLIPLMRFCRRTSVAIANVKYTTESFKKLLSCCSWSCCGAVLRGAAFQFFFFSLRPTSSSSLLSPFSRKLASSSFPRDLSSLPPLFSVDRQLRRRSSSSRKTYIWSSGRC